MALEGTLKDFSLADIFQLIGIQRKTGVLRLKQTKEEVTVSFLDGAVVGAESSAKNLEYRLGYVLVKSGRITEQQLQRCLKTQKETLQRLGHILVNGDFISREDLSEALGLQITQIVYRLFRWEDGDYHFAQSETIEYDKEHFSPLSAESILMEGIRMIDEWPVIEQKIKSFDIVFRKTNPDVAPVIIDSGEDDELDLNLEEAFSNEEAAPVAPEVDESLKLHAEDARLYELVNGKRTVQELIDEGGKSDFETCRILYDMLSRDLITAADESRRTHAAARKVAVGPLIERVAVAVLFLLSAASLATMQFSPMSGSASLLVPAGAGGRINELVAINRIERLNEAVKIYYLQKGFFPDDLRDLVTGGLVSPAALRDPWGRRFGFLSASEGYRIIAYDGGGIENPGRSIEWGRLPVARTLTSPGESSEAARENDGER